MPFQKLRKMILKYRYKGLGINMNGFSIKSLKLVNKKIVQVIKSQIDAEQDQKETEKITDSEIQVVQVVVINVNKTCPRQPKILIYKKLQLSEGVTLMFLYI